MIRYLCIIAYLAIFCITLVQVARPRQRTIILILEVDRQGYIQNNDTMLANAVQDTKHNDFTPTFDIDGDDILNPRGWSWPDEFASDSPQLDAREVMQHGRQSATP